MYHNGNMRGKNHNWKLLHVCYKGREIEDRDTATTGGIIINDWTGIYYRWTSGSTVSISTMEQISCISVFPITHLDLIILSQRHICVGLFLFINLFGLLHCMC